MWESLLFLSLAASAAALPAGGLHISSPRHQYVNEKGAVKPEILTLFNNTLKKYTSTHVLKSFEGLSDLASKRAVSVTNDPLQDQCDGTNDVLYYGPISIRNKTFTIDFDTGSSDLFVPGPDCGASQGCAGTTKYDLGGKDLGNSTSVTYGSGAVSGRNYLDTVSIGNLTANNVNVIALSNARGFSDSTSEGLMGMGFSKLAKSKQPTFVETLINNGQITDKQFCFYLGRCGDKTGVNSELTIGGRDSKKYTGDFTTVPVKSKDYWRVNIDGVSTTGVNLDVPGDAAIDTGTTSLVMSSAYATPLNTAMGGIPLALGGSGNLQITAYAVSCNVTSTITLKFAGKQFAINTKDLFLGTVDLSFAELLGNQELIDRIKGTGMNKRQATPTGPMCLSAILQADVGATMNPPVANFNIVGDTFLKNWYSCFSYDASSGQPAVLFAKSV